MYATTWNLEDEGLFQLLLQYLYIDQFLSKTAHSSILKFKEEKKKKEKRKSQIKGIISSISSADGEQPTLPSNLLHDTIQPKALQSLNRQSAGLLLSNAFVSLQLCVCVTFCPSNLKIRSSLKRNSSARKKRVYTRFKKKT